MGDTVLRRLDGLQSLDEAERTFQMDEETFRVFYDVTARPLWLYLARLTGDERLAEDLLQEAYYRLLRTATPFESEEHRKNYLFRIATNLARDHRRRPSALGAVAEPAATGEPADRTPADRAAQHIDLARAMRRLKPRERSLLWLAYAHGWSHAEIAASLGLKTGSLKALLYRARRRLAHLLTAPGGSR